MKGLSSTYVESAIRAFAKGRMNARQGTLAARGQRRISGVPGNAKVNHSLLKIGNKIVLFSGNKKYKLLFAPFFAETETRPLQKAKERHINELSIKNDFSPFSHPIGDFAKRGKQAKLAIV